MDAITASRQTSGAYWKRTKAELHECKYIGKEYRKMHMELNQNVMARR
jgi:hypothetical protein